MSRPSPAQFTRTPAPRTALPQRANSSAAQASLDPYGLDAIGMLGTGMPTLRPILAHGYGDGGPVLSCMLCLARRSVEAAAGPMPQVYGDGWAGETGRQACTG